MKRDEAIARLRRDIGRIQQAYPVRSLALFGSTARDEATAESDVDVLVEFTETVSLFDLAGLKLMLEDALGCTVDLVTADALRPAARNTILSEAIRAA